MDAFYQPTIYSLLILLGSTVIFNWFPRQRSLTLSLLVISLVIALYGGFIEIAGIIILLLVGATIYLFYSHNSNLFLKALTGVILTFLGMMLFLHWAPGFHNPLVLEGIQLANDSVPYRTYLNIDKVSVGILLLAIGVHVGRTYQEWKQGFIDACLPLTAAIIILAITGMAVDYIRFDPKIPSITLFWCLFNLLLVVVIEEAFFRGFLQHYLKIIFKNTSQVKILSIIISSALFALIHYRGGPAFIGLSAIASCLYGYAYSRHNLLEASIITHFGLNAAHFFLFSYPALLK